MRNRHVLIASIFFLALSRFTFAAAPALDPIRMAQADQIINDAVGRGDIPGAVLLVGRGAENIYLKAYGNRAVQPGPLPMKPDTIFDMASLSKSVGCATSIMILADRGKLKVSDPVSKYIPAFAANGKESITIELLLLHRSGLIPDNPLSDYKDGPAAAFDAINKLKPTKPPGTAFIYSDVNYIVLGELVKIIDGRPLDQFAREEVFIPLGMKETMYNPPAELRERCAYTEKRGDKWMMGEVHDPRSYALGGVAGHAGLFSTAEDLARWCRLFLGGGQVNGKRILSEATFKELTTSRCLPDGTGCRNYGLDVNTGYSSARGNRFEPGTTYGHTGFTGTSFWIDPKHDCFLVFLTNRVHPNGKGEIIQLRRKVATIVAEALLDPPLGAKPDPIQPRPAPDGRRAADGAPNDVLCGIDVLKKENFKSLDGRKVALITNHTGRDREGNRTVDVLMGAKNLTLVRLFSPEHGLYGALDEKVGHTTDPKSGLKVFSLYGETRRPTAEMLEGIDTFVFDIQDIGARYYTYPSTMGNCMEEAAKQHIKMVVLDRPNPITGLMVDGPIADKSHLSFVAGAPIPIVHGLTIGEMAKLINTELNIHCDLSVIELQNWKRSMWFDETGLVWVNPSPNMRNTTEALLYPAVGMIEYCNVSVGRGTDQPFEIFGAPWIDGSRLSEALNASRLPGLRFVPIEFTPTSSKFKDKLCHGVYIVVTDRNIVQPARTGTTIVWLLHSMFREDFQIDPVSRLLVNDETLSFLRGTLDPATIPSTWDSALSAFRAMRQKYLIYPN